MSGVRGRGGNAQLIDVRYELLFVFSLYLSFFLSFFVCQFCYPHMARILAGIDCYDLSRLIMHCPWSPTKDHIAL